MNWESIIDLHAAMLENAEKVHAKTGEHKDLTAHEIVDSVVSQHPVETGQTQKG